MAINIFHMNTNNLLEWQQDFIDNYVENPPETALLITAPGMGKTRATLKAWERLSIDYNYENLIILTSAVALKDQWKNLVQESISYKTFTRNTIVNNIQQYYNTENLTRLNELYHSSKTFMVIDDFHRIAHSEIMKKIVYDFNKENHNYSKTLFLSGLHQEVFKLALDDSFPIGREYVYDGSILIKPQTKIEITRFSPSYGILQKLLKQRLRVDDLSWREFEKLVAQLLESDGFQIELMNGTKDGGVDIIATKLNDISGYYKTLWQAKKFSKNKVTLSTIRELADSVNEFSASKGVIVTTTFLTKDALCRVERDKYTLGKVDRVDLDNWINRILYK